MYASVLLFQLSDAEIYSKKFGSNPRFILTPQSFTEVTLSMQPGDSGTLERFAMVLNEVYIFTQVCTCILDVCGTVSMVITKGTCP
jgi:hypothetical protein